VGEAVVTICIAASRAEIVGKKRYRNRERERVKEGFRENK
jgi:hypothetical protein